MTIEYEINEQKVRNRISVISWHTSTKFIVNILICIIVLQVGLSAQQIINRDTNDISLNASNYLFSYNTKFNKGSFATGPTISLNTNGKITLQFGLLYDFRKYISYEKHMNTSNGGFDYKQVNNINLFIPFVFHYNVFNYNTVTLYATAGCMVSGYNTLEEENISSNHFNLIFGTGISYRALKRFAFRINPTIRYNKGIFFPGVMIDFSYFFSHKKLAK